MKGLILAAGEGKRLNSLSQKLNLPKALIPVFNRPMMVSPFRSGDTMIEYGLDNFKKTKIKEICIIIPPGEKEKFKESLEKPGLRSRSRLREARFGGRREVGGVGYDFEFVYLVQEVAQGTAKALELAKDFIGKENILLTYCDLITFYDFNKLILEHKKYHPIATILVNKEKDPRVTGLVKWEGEYVTRIVEKPKEKFSEYGSAGLMVLEPIIFSALPYIKPTAEGEYHIGDALQYLIDRGHKVRYKIIDTWRINLNKPEDIEKVEKLIEQEYKVIKGD